jgi:hypothetical protein
MLHKRFLEVKICSKAFLALCRGYGKSPWFLEVAFLWLFGVDARVLKVASLNVVEFLECAFCYGNL